MAAGSNDEAECADAMLTPMTASATPVPSLPITPSGTGIGGFLSKAASKSAWAIVDQAVVSIGNYATVIFVGRNLTDSAAFGNYNLVMESFLFLCTLQQAMVIVPLLTRGAVLDEPRMRRLAGGCLLATLLLCIPLTMGMAGVSSIFVGKTLLLWAPLALVFQQLQETVRRTMLAHLRFKEAVFGDSLSYLGQAAILFAVGTHLTLPIVFAVMAITSALAMIVQAFQIGPRWFPPAELPALLRDFWPVSKWLLYSALGTIVTLLSYNWMLRWRTDATEVACFGVMAGLIKLSNPLIQVLGGLIIPTVARAKAGGGTRFAMKIGLRYSLLGLAMLLPYFGILALFPQTCIRLVYGSQHPQYLQLGGYLRILLCTWTFLFVTNMTLAVLNGLGYTRANFNTNLCNALLTVFVALPLIYWLGLKGVVIGGSIATIAATAVAVYAFVRHHNDAPPQWDAAGEPAG
jgi:O-antigen/teichoic acid export membrane protein